MNYEFNKALINSIRELVQQEITNFLTGNGRAIRNTAIGTVTTDYVSGLPKVRFDSDEAASGMRYSYLAGVTLAANDRVLLLKVGSSWAVVGKLVNS